MKTSDYIVEFLIQQKITDVFGYPGGMVTHLMDSLEHYSGRIHAHLNYQEQACAMSACAWAEMTGLPGVAYATSGPGATNLLTGIACAYFESLPCIFITGQVNTYEHKGDLKVRQLGFQETDVASMAAPVTKKTYRIVSSTQIPSVLENAYRTAMTGRRGPVLIDIPMDVLRGDICGAPSPVTLAKEGASRETEKNAAIILSALCKAKRPVILAGHGISLSQTRAQFRRLVDITGIPVVTSMIAVDTIPSTSPSCFGMIGAYGVRWANFIIDYSDCILTLGSRLDCRQTGVNKDLFAPHAQIFRIDVDAGELENRIGSREQQLVFPLQELLPVLAKQAETMHWDFADWRSRCSLIREKLRSVDTKEPGNILVEKISQMLPDQIVVTTDVGQNQVWVGQSIAVQKNQRVLFSGGHGAMGYSLPAAIGAALATGRPVVCFAGDGGLQMNIQELEFVKRERLPIKIILINNCALGMIHHFQEMYFNSNYMQTVNEKGYTVPEFCRIAQAYGIRAFSDPSDEQFYSILRDDSPAFIEWKLPQANHVFPKLGMNCPIHEQEPKLSEMQMQEVIDICLNLER